jgi:hypothetical protein
MIFRKHLLTNVKTMIFLADDAKKIQHDGLLGRLKEIFLDELLNPYLGPTMKTCTGIVINSTGKQSKQIDIIIYDSEIIPPAILRQEAGVIPVESVLATIEIKSTLTSKTLKNSILNGISIKKLGFHPSVIRSVSLHNIPSYVFAFSSDLADLKKTEKQRVEEAIDKYGEGYQAPISAVCVVNKPYIYFSYDQKKEENDADKYKWYEIQSNNQYEEILHFISKILDNCFNIKQERRNISISHYIF